VLHGFAHGLHDKSGARQQPIQLDNDWKTVSDDPHVTHGAGFGHVLHCFAHGFAHELHAANEGAANITATATNNITTASFFIIPPLLAL